MRGVKGMRAGRAQSYLCAAQGVRVCWAHGLASARARAMHWLLWLRSMTVAWRLAVAAQCDPTLHGGGGRGVDSMRCARGTVRSLVGAAGRCTASSAPSQYFFGLIGSGECGDARL